MVKEQLIELICLKMSGGDAPASLRGVYSPQEISLYLEMVFSDMINEAYKQGSEMNDFSQVDNYIQRYFFTPKYNTSTDERYIELTVQPCPLPYNFSIRQISAKKDQVTTVFAPIDAVALSVFNQLEVNFVDGTPGYYYEGSNIYFDDKYPEGLENIMVKMIVGFDALKDSDQVFIPNGNNTVIFEKVCQLMLKPSKINQDNMVTKQP